MLNYIALRVFEYFEKHDKDLAVSRTVNFLTLLQGTFLVPIFILLNVLFNLNPHVLGDDTKMKYYIGIPLAIFLIGLNNHIFKNKLKGDRLSELKLKYHKERYPIHIWIIFILPVIFVFVFPILFGLFNGTLRVVHH